MRSALIIGAGGQDGQLLGHLLLDRGYVVRGWTRTAVTTPVPFECAVIDLLDAASIENELRTLAADEIYYLAAFHHATEDSVAVSPAELLQRSFDVHVNGLLNVLRAMANVRVSSRLFYAASSHVFGAPTGGMQDERTPFQAQSAYGISKAAGVQCCRFYREQEGVFAAAGFLFNHESSLRRPSFLSQKIVRGAWRARSESDFKLILGDLDARVDWGYAPDYVDAMSRILQLPQPDDFVIASGELHTVREFAEIAFRAVGLDWRRHVIPDPALLRKSSQTLCGDAAKLRAATGWSATIRFEEMVRTLIREADLNRQESGSSQASEYPAAPRATCVAA